jgi:hypothetical protein
VVIAPCIGFDCLQRTHVRWYTNTLQVLMPATTSSSGCR